MNNYENVMVNMMIKMHFSLPISMTVSYPYTREKGVLSVGGQTVVR